MMLKKLFPIFEKKKDLVYLDSAATSLKPQSVIDAITDYSTSYSSNVGRGLYPIADQATSAFEAAREKVAQFIHANPEEIIFTSGTTHSINLAAQLLNPSISSGDNIVITELEHHSNFLPWKELAQSKGTEFRLTPFADEGLIDTEIIASLIDESTRIVAFSAISNVLGGINPVADIIRIIKKKNPNCMVLVDAAQAVGHIDIDVRAWDADFIAFSGHKMYGPTGIGVLYGRKELLEKCLPVSFGGGMVSDSTLDNPEYREIPHRFEAGTPNISGAIGLGAAIDFIDHIGMEEIRNHDIEITTYVIEKLTREFRSDIEILGPKNPKDRSSLISFTLKEIHPHDLAQILGEKNICIRAGEHCAAPLHRKLSLPATARVSFGIYTDTRDIDTLIINMINAQGILNTH